MKNPFRSLTLTLLLASSATLFAQTPAPSAAGVKQLGSIQKINGSQLSLATDKDGVIQVIIQPGARLFRFAPGQTDAKSATPIQVTDLQIGDRVLVRGSLAGDGTTLNASAVAVMKQQDIAQLKQRELLDWQRRSVGGLVKQVDPAAGVITLTVAGKPVVVNTTPKTTCKRYAPDSVKWEDATAAKLEDIHPGDQLRAKGNKSEDGTQLTAEEIVAGTFRNISGLVTAVDSAQGALTVQDLATKKPVNVRITADSQMKKLPSQLAYGLAARMKGSVAPAGAPTAAPKAAEASTAASSPDVARPRNGDLNQLLARLPAATLDDLKKGDAVMILSTEGSASQSPTAITLLGGVEPLLTASPTGTGAQSFLTPWSLASAPGGDQQ
jgi:hypothetical protein